MSGFLFEGRLGIMTTYYKVMCLKESAALDVHYTKNCPSVENDAVWQVHGTWTVWKNMPPARHNGISGLLAQIQIYCDCSRKETGNAKTAVAPQVYLLQPTVMTWGCKNECHASSVCYASRYGSGTGRTASCSGHREIPSNDRIRTNKVRVNGRQTGL